MRSASCELRLEADLTPQKLAWARSSATRTYRIVSHRSPCLVVDWTGLDYPSGPLRNIRGARTTTYSAKVRVTEPNDTQNHHCSEPNTSSAASWSLPQAVSHNPPSWLPFPSEAATHAHVGGEKARCMPKSCKTSNANFPSVAQVVGCAQRA